VGNVGGGERGAHQQIAVDCQLSVESVCATAGTGSPQRAQSAHRHARAVFLIPEAGYLTLASE